MDKQRALDLLRTQIAGLRPLQYAKVHPALDKWKRDTCVVLEKMFGEDSKHVKEFEGFYFWSGVITRDKALNRRNNIEAFDKGKLEAEAFLESVISEIEEFHDNTNNTREKSCDPLIEISRLCARFHLVSRQLRVRHDNRATLNIEDEYDVQDLLHDLLKLEFDDIRPEECTPSYAGKSARVDFLIKEHKIVIEVKKTRKGLEEKEVGDQLLVDIGRYGVHPDCRTLVCFVYDPEGRIGNPVGLENDLSGERDGLNVVIIIGPK